MNQAKSFVARSLLKNKNFTIISDDCWGGEVYRELNLPYMTPFIGCFINPEDYLHLLQNIEHHLCLPLRFIDSTKKLPNTELLFPVALLGDIEINFMHYKTPLEAKEKWERRLKRINLKNVFYKIDFTRPGPYGKRAYLSKDIEQWSQLCLSNSIAITDKAATPIHNSLLLYNRDDNAVITYWRSRHKFSLIHWLDSGVIRNTLFNQISMRLTAEDL